MGDYDGWRQKGSSLEDIGTVLHARRGGDWSGAKVGELRKEVKAALFSVPPGQRW